MAVTTTSLPQSVLDAVSTPERDETRLGLIEFQDGAPSEETAARDFDNLDFLRGVDVFLNALKGASTCAIREGFLSVGVEDNSFLIFSELMDSQSLFLTANADSIYYLAIVDLSEGPLVVETPPMALGLFDDMWFRWVTDFGLPGPDRGAGGRYLLLPPGYDGDVPDGGFHVSRARTSRVNLIGRSFLTDNDPRPTVETIKRALKIYPYTPAAYGTSITTLLEGKIRPGQAATPPPTRIVEGSGLAINTIPRTTSGFTSGSTRSFRRRAARLWIPRSWASSPRSGSSRTNPSSRTPG
jgi:hypothetical protein